MTARADILNALFALLSTATPFETLSQRLQFWTDVNAQPALFLRYVADEYPPRPIRGLPPARMQMHCEVWLYALQPDVDVAPILTLAPLIDAVAAVLRPTGATATQDLGLTGVVSHCWIEGRTLYDSGDRSGQVIAMIPVRIEVITPPG